jgi:type IV pilus assembly protein PilW
MTRGPRSLSRGFTLIEILVAMTLSLLIIAGIGQIYLAAKRSYEIQTNLAQIQDVGRYVTDTLTHDIHMAGYWDLMDINLANSTPGNDGNPGGIPSGDSFFLTGWQNAPEGCTSDDSWGRMINRKIFGINDGSGIGAYSCIGGDLLQGDVLTVRYADPALVSLPPGDTRLYIKTAPFEGSVIAFDAGGAPVPNYTDHVIDTVSSTHLLVAHAYYVASPISTSCGTVPVFARKTLDGNGTPRKESLVNGVEQLQFQYGVDTAITAANPTGDGTVNQYLDAEDVADWTQVRSVRYWVLVRANCPESGYTDNNKYYMGNLGASAPPYEPHDHYRRALYSSTVALRN